jgi:hypothetical protein
VECPEFRELLLYACPEIQDSELAKRDKIHDMIVDASADYIEVLRKELGVSSSFLKTAHYLQIFISLPWAKLAIRRICGQKRIANHFMQLPRTGFVKQNRV